MAHKGIFQTTKCGLGRFAAAAHLAEPGNAFIGFHFNNCSNKPTPVTPVRMTERRFKWDGDCCRADVSNLNGSLRSSWGCSRALGSTDAQPQAAVDADGLSCDEACVVARQKHAKLCDLFGRAHTQ